MATLRFLSLECFDTEDEGSRDDILMTANGKNVFGGKKHIKMSEGDVRDLDFVTPVQFKRRALVRLYDYDSIGADDWLGDHTVQAIEAGQGEQTAQFLYDEANYTLRYIVE